MVSPIIRVTRPSHGLRHSLRHRTIGTMVPAADHLEHSVSASPCAPAKLTPRAAQSRQVTRPWAKSQAGTQWQLRLLGDAGGVHGFLAVQACGARLDQAGGQGHVVRDGLQGWGRRGQAQVLGQPRSLCSASPEGAWALPGSTKLSIGLRDHLQSSQPITVHTALYTCVSSWSVVCLKAQQLSKHLHGLLPGGAEARCVVAMALLATGSAATLSAVAH